DGLTLVWERPSVLGFFFASASASASTSASAPLRASRALPLARASRAARGLFAARGLPFQIGGAAHAPQKASCGPRRSASGAVRDARNRGEARGGERSGFRSGFRF